MNLKQKTIHGLKWSYFSTISNAVMQIGYVAVMARLLEPAAFGLVAMAQVVLRFGSYFAQMGMGQALIQKKELSKENIRAAFTSSFFLGFIFFVIIYIGAPLSLYIFNDIEVIPIIRVMALSFVLTGLSTTSVSLLRRNFRFKELAIVEISSYAIGYVGVGITSALLGFGVWSLIFAALTQAFVVVVISYLLVRHSLKLLFKWAHYQKLFSFGSKVSVISFLEYLRGSIDTIFIGKFFSASALGFYNRGYRLINLPLYFLTTSSTRVIYPAFSTIQNDIEKLKKNYLKAIMIFSQILFPLSVIAIIGAKEIVLTILGNKWLESIVILKILALTSVFMLLAHISGLLLESIAKLKIKVFVVSISLIIIIISMFLLKEDGIVGVAISTLLGFLFPFFSYFIVIKKILKFSYKNLIKHLMPGLVTAVISGVVIFLLNYLGAFYNLTYFELFFSEIILGLILILIMTIYSPFNILKMEVKDILINFKIIDSTKEIE